QPKRLSQCRSGRRRPHSPVLEPIGPSEPLGPSPLGASRPPPLCPLQAGAAAPSAALRAPQSLGPWLVQAVLHPWRGSRSWVVGEETLKSAGLEGRLNECE